MVQALPVRGQEQVGEWVWGVEVVGGEWGEIALEPGPVAIAFAPVVGRKFLIRWAHLATT